MEVEREVVVSVVATVVVAATRLRKCKLQKAKCHMTQLTPRTDCKNKCC